MTHGLIGTKDRDRLRGPAPSTPMNRIRGPELAALGTFLLHALGGGRYGIFRDELYFIACGERLATGYVDQPPVIAIIARIAHALFGTWVPGLRLLPWLASALMVWVVGRLAARLGASPAGATLAALTAMAAPLLLGLGHLLTMNAFEPLLWVAIALFLVRLVGGADPREWLAVGLLTGIAVLNKYSAAPFVLALAAGLVVTPERRVLRSRWMLAGAGLAAVLVLPNFVWQVQHGLPFLELVRNGQAHKNAELSTLAFFRELVLQPNPIAAPLWLGGLGWLLFARAARPHRFLGIGALLVLVFLTVSKAKPYYVGPLFPLLFAAGAAAVDPFLRARSWARIAVPAAVVLVGAIGWPMAVPLLPKETFVAYQRALGIEAAPMERHRLALLPQTYADMFGWEDLARGVAEAAKTLTPEERAQAVVYGQNYGEAGALELFGPQLGAPPAISGHNQYWLWGIPEGRGAVLLVISDEHEDCGNAYRRKDVALKLPSNPWVIPYEDERWIWICRDPVKPLEAIWPETRHYI